MNAADCFRLCISDGGNNSNREFDAMLRMREFVFTIEFKPGTDPLADVFITHPDLIATALTISISKSGMWRLDRVRGPDDALQEFKRTYTDPVYCIECGGDQSECTSEWEFEILAEHNNNLTVYSFLKRLPQYCHSIPHLAIREFGDGLIFDSQRRENVYEWRILMPEQYPVGNLFDKLRDGTGDKTRLTLRQIRSPSRWGEHITTIADLPHEQRQAVEMAVREGYYSTPRSTDLVTLATQMDIPKSTLRYRLRRAEAWLIESFVANHGLLDYSTEESLTKGVEEHQA